jgi:hypothetical protein
MTEVRKKGKVSTGREASPASRSGWEGAANWGAPEGIRVNFKI